MSNTPRRGPNGRFLTRQDRPDVQVEALKLRGQGVAYGPIAVLLDVPKSTVFHLVQDAYEREVQDSAPVARALELERLDRDLVTVNRALGKAHAVMAAAEEQSGPTTWPVILKCLDRIARLTETRGRISERRAKLIGLDAPATVRVEAGESVGIPVHEVLDRIATAVRPFPDAAAAVSLVLFELRESLLADGPES